MLTVDHRVQCIGSAQVFDVELLSFGCPHAERANRIPRMRYEDPVYPEGNKVLIASVASFSGPKWPAFRSEYYGRFMWFALGICAMK